MNNLHFEEVMPGNLERECIEETCDSQGWDFNNRLSQWEYFNSNLEAPIKWYREIIKIHYKNFMKFLTIIKIQLSSSTMTVKKSSKKVSFCL